MANKALNFNSPKGVAQFAWLNTPDTAFGQDSVYKVNLRMTPDEAKDFMEACQTVANDNHGDKAKGSHMPYEKDNDTGEVIVKFKSKYKPRFCDTTGQVVKNEPKVGSGSTLKIKGNFYPYSTGSRIGVSLQMSAVQIIDLVEFGGGAQFEPEEGTFKSEGEAKEGTGYDF